MSNEYLEGVLMAQSDYNLHGAEWLQEIVRDVTVKCEYDDGYLNMSEVLLGGKEA